MLIFDEVVEYMLVEVLMVELVYFIVVGCEFMFDVVLMYEVFIKLFGLLGVGFEVGGVLLSLLLVVMVYLLVVGCVCVE